MSEEDFVVILFKVKIKDAHDPFLLVKQQEAREGLGREERHYLGVFLKLDGHATEINLDHRPLVESVQFNFILNTCEDQEHSEILPITCN